MANSRFMGRKGEGSPKGRVPRRRAEPKCAGLMEGSTGDPGAQGWIVVRGARQNNLRNVDVVLPRGAIVACTGVSGSGKSSLAFATIYAEAERRYLETIAPYARRLIRQVGEADVDTIEGLPPAVALSQARGAFSARSTVGTVTTISHLLRLLFSRAGSYPRGATGHLDADAFSPNTPHGACPTCQGTGRVQSVDEARLVADRRLSIRQGAIRAWPGAWQGKNLRDIVLALGIDVDRPFSRLPRSKQRWLLLTDEQPIVWVEPGEDRNEYPYNGKFVSAKRHVLQTLASSPSERQRRWASQFVVSAPCPACRGQRLGKAALAVKFKGRSIAELGSLPVERLLRLLAAEGRRPEPAPSRPKPRDGAEQRASASLLRGIVQRIQPLIELGLGHLTLDRVLPSLSPGEVQRLRLAASVHAGLFGVLYVLDEPSAGLHPADAAPLFDLLRRLRDAGNSLLVVEHELRFVSGADWVVDIGPGAGARGGRVLYSGPVRGLSSVAASQTGQHLFGSSPSTGAPDGKRGPRLRRPVGEGGWLILNHARYRNVRDLSVRFPLGVLTAVCGVSGSGKSTLVSTLLSGAFGHDPVGQNEGEVSLMDQELADALSRLKLEGASNLRQVVTLDQKPIGRTSRSNLATYTGLFDKVRRAFASTRAARRRGYGPGRFSFNLPEGRCEHCQGSGEVEVELIFLQTHHAPCPACHGKRYNDATLKVLYEGKNIAEVLDLTVEAALDFFSAEAPIARILSVLSEVGLGYLRLGQPAPELSGGEAQRIKLATEIARGRQGAVLYLLDEPTANLHPADTSSLIRKLQDLVDRGATVVVVEHNVQVLAEADWVIELGPGGGERGGTVVAEGAPETIAQSRTSKTARFLAAVINQGALGNTRE